MPVHPQFEVIGQEVMKWHRLRYCWYRLKRFVHAYLTRGLHLPLCHGVSEPCFRLGKRRRQMTAYCKDEMNWVFVCPTCLYDINEHWKDMWDEYYSMVGGW